MIVQVQDIPSVILQKCHGYSLKRNEDKDVYYALFVPHPPAAPDAAAIASICSLDNAIPRVVDFGAIRGCLD